MISEEVVAYVRSALGQGATRDAVRSELAKTGWTADQITQIFERVTSAPPPGTPRSDISANTTPIKQTMNTSEQESATQPKKRSRLGLVFVVIVVLIIVGAGAYMYFASPAVSEDAATGTPTGNTATTGQPGAVDQNNAFDIAINTPILSDGQRLGSVLHQFSTVVPQGWGIVATSTDGYMHFDVVHAETGPAGGVVRISRYLTLYPETVTLKEIAEKERGDLKSRAEGFTEKDFKKTTLAGRDAYVITASSRFNNTDVEITAHMFLDKGRYYIITGISAGATTAPDFASTMKAIVDGFQITAI